MEAADRVTEAVATFNAADLLAQSIAKDGDWFFFLNYDDEAMLERIAPDFVRNGKTDEYKIEPFAMVQMEYYEGTNVVKKWKRIIIYEGSNQIIGFTAAFYRINCYVCASLLCRYLPSRFCAAKKKT